MYSASWFRCAFPPPSPILRLFCCFIFLANRNMCRKSENTSALWRREEEGEDISITNELCARNVWRISCKYFLGDFQIYYSSSSLSSSKFAAAYICFVNTGLVDRLARPPAMMFDWSTSSPDKSSMTSEFSESELSCFFFFFFFLSVFCFFCFGSPSSSVLSASSW